MGHNRLAYKEVVSPFCCGEHMMDQPQSIAYAFFL